MKANKDKLKRFLKRLDGKVVLKKRQKSKVLTHEEVKSMVEKTNEVSFKRDVFLLKKIKTIKPQNITERIEIIKPEVRTEVVREVKELDTKEIKRLEGEIETMRGLVLRQSQLGGGSMNRQIKVDGTDVLRKFTDINLVAGSGVTLTATDDNTDENVDITIEASASGGAWGDITGTLSDQTDLQTALDAKADDLTADQNYVTDAQLVVIGNTSGTNTGDQTTIVGITGTKAQFDTAVTDGNFLYVGDVPTLTSGVYTPTRSAEANMDANVTMSEAQYLRVGNTVTVSGRFTADPALTATTTSFEITLPVASNLGAAEDAAGVAFCGNIVSMGAEIIGVVANDTAKFQWKSSDITSQVWSYTFSYSVI